MVTGAFAYIRYNSDFPKDDRVYRIWGYMDMDVTHIENISEFRKLALKWCERKNATLLSVETSREHRRS